MYAIIDRQTGKQVGRLYKNKNRARTRRDKLDLAYGAYKHFVRDLETMRSLT